ncbi:MAG: hypothetical protein R3F47_03170 [Gammaproteobacteria bacterium]|jgi:hydrogenase maturation protease
MAPSPTRISIFLFGNEARGDDALGEHLHAMLQETFAADPAAYAHIQLILDFQLAPEHIFDLKSTDCGIFVDAHTDADSGVQWQRVQPGSQLHFSSHYLPAESLLFLYESTFGEPPPPCYLLSLGGESFELEQTLSATAQQHLAVAFKLIQEKLALLAQSPDSGAPASRIAESG